MIFDNMGACMKSVITALVILSSVGLVSPQNQLEHHLATDCTFKSMKIEYKTATLSKAFKNDLVFSR